jgi:hypothetical protein
MTPTIQINLPINKVVELFMDKSNFKEWKKDFISYEHISGIPGEVGAVTKLVSKRVTMFETITSKNFPAEIIEEYEHKRGVKTVMVHKASNRFISIAENRTLFEVEMAIIKVDGFLLKLMMKLMAGAGRKYAQDQLNQFKVFAEKQHTNEANPLKSSEHFRVYRKLNYTN